ncbi:MAG TPA: hypothetical protein VJ802_04465 [Gemmatimonadaceae bacterium]|nr:hypothetical protein [Gemmatimonadaceae bacterium]
MRFALRVLLLALSFAIGTWVLGWWSVPLFATVGAVMARHVRQQGIAAALAAVAAWAALLGWSASHGSVWSFSRIAGGAMGISGVALILVTLLFPAALAWLATVVAQFIAQRLWRRTEG